MFPAAMECKFFFTSASIINAITFIPYLYSFDFHPFVNGPFSHTMALPLAHPFANKSTRYPLVYEHPWSAFVSTHPPSYFFLSFFFISLRSRPTLFTIWPGYEAYIRDYNDIILCMSLTEGVSDNKNNILSDVSHIPMFNCWRLKLSRFKHNHGRY